MGQAAGAWAPPCRVGQSSEMLCFQLALRPPKVLESGNLHIPAARLAGHKPKHGLVLLLRPCSPGASGASAAPPPGALSGVGGEQMGR